MNICIDIFIWLVFIYISTKCLRVYVLCVYMCTRINRYICVHRYISTRVSASSSFWIYMHTYTFIYTHWYMFTFKEYDVFKCMTHGEVIRFIYIKCTRISRFRIYISTYYEHIYIYMCVHIHYVTSILCHIQSSWRQKGVISAWRATFRETHTDSDVNDESVMSHTSEYVISHIQDMTAKVGDFGMARDFSRNKRMAVGREICTLWYEIHSYVRIIYFHTCIHPHPDYVYTNQTYMNLTISVQVRLLLWYLCFYISSTRIVECVYINEDMYGWTSKYKYTYT